MDIFTPFKYLSKSTTDNYVLSVGVDDACKIINIFKHFSFLLRRDAGDVIWIQLERATISGAVDGPRHTGQARSNLNNRSVNTNEVRSRL